MCTKDVNGGVLTIEAYLYGQANFPISEECVKNILIRRGLSAGTPITDVERRLSDLCTADLYVWICTSPNRVGAVTDQDNGWSHSDGGFTLTDADKTRLMKLADAIYERYDEPVSRKSRIRITHHGIKPCNYNLDGTPL